MVSDSWEMVQILQQDKVISQDQWGTKMEVQMSIILALCMIFQLGLIKKQHDGEMGLIKKQHDGKIPIGSH